MFALLAATHKRAAVNPNRDYALKTYSDARHREFDRR